MQDVFTYLLKSSGLMVAFFLAYHLLLRKETFFTANRWFLLTGLITSALLPLFFIKKIRYVERPKLTIDDMIALSSQTATKVSNAVPVKESIDWIQIAVISYGIVVAVLFVKILLNLFSVWKLVHGQKVQKEERYAIIDINKAVVPFSFFNYIVFNSRLYAAEELENIICHEKVHSKQKHSLDVLLAHFFTIIFWINPIVWWYKKAVIQNLEFIADHHAIQQIEDKKAYQKTLLKVVSHQSCLPITNHFYQSLIKKRIVMLNKNQSHSSNSWKYAAVLPALIAFVFLFQVRVVAQEKKAKTTSDAVKATAIGYVTNKDATNEEMKNDTKTAKEQLGLDYKFSNVKRNDKGEIIAIKIEYKTKEGKSGKIEVDSDEPIEPIYFNAEGDKIGFTKMNAPNFAQNNNSSDKTVFRDIKINTSKENEDVKGTQNSIIIINGQKYDDATLRDLDPNFIQKIDVITDKDVVKKYDEKDKHSVIMVTTKTIKDSENITVRDKPIVFSNDNGDDIVITDNYKLFKVPGSPSVLFSENAPVLIVNGNVQSNPKATLEIMDVNKIKSVRIYDENDKESKGTPIKKVVITTK